MYPPGSKYFRSKSYIHARNKIVYSNFKLTKMYILIFIPTQILQNVTNRYTANFLLVPINNYIFKQFLFCSKHNYVCNL